MGRTSIFIDRVMEVVGTEPAAGPGRALDQAMRERSVRDARDSVRVAWRLARLHAMPRVVRVQAAALVLVVASTLAAGGVLATVATVRTVAPIVRAEADHPADDARAVPPSLVPTPAPTSSKPLRPIVPLPAVVPQVVEPHATTLPDGDPAVVDEPEDHEDDAADAPSSADDRDDSHDDGRDDDRDRDDGDAAPGDGGDASDHEDSDVDDASDRDDDTDADDRDEDAGPGSDEDQAEDIGEHDGDGDHGSDSEHDDDGTIGGSDDGDDGGGD